MYQKEKGEKCHENDHAHKGKALTVNPKKNIHSHEKGGNALVNILKKAISVLLCVLILTGISATGFSADAAVVEENSGIGSVDGIGSVTISQGQVYTYQTGLDFTAYKYSTQSGSGNAFCFEPTKGSPTGEAASKTFSADKISIETNENVLKALYYGYGGPGFNVVNSAFYANGKYLSPRETMDYYKSTYYLTLGGEEYYYAFTHIVAAYFKYGADGYSASLSGYWDQATKSFANIIKNLPSVKTNMQAYVVDTGTNTQKMVFPVFRINLKMVKESTNPNFTNNNSAYSLQGAQFVVFTDKDKAEKAAKATFNTEARKAGAISGYIQTDAYGNGKFYNMGYGSSSSGSITAVVDSAKTYYVVEYRPPVMGGNYAGYYVNNQVYRFIKTDSVDSKGLPIYATSFKEEPRMYLEVYKRSGDTSVTDGNS